MTEGIIINKVEEKKLSSKGNEEYVERVTIVHRDLGEYKITSNVKKTKEKKKVKQGVADRMKIPKFGLCTGQPRGSLEAGVVMISKEEVKIINRQTEVEQDLKDRLLGSINKTKDNFMREMIEAKERENKEKIEKLFSANKKTVVVKKTYKRENSVRVAGFNPRYIEEDLRKIFEKAGRIRKIYIPKDFNTGENKNFAFIDYEQSLGMKNALEMLHDLAVDNCVLSVTPTEDK